MLARLQLVLQEENTEDKLNFRKSSALQGAMFEHIDSDYASFLHQQNMHPYSQYFCFEGEQPTWVISTTSDKAYEHMVLPLLSSSFQEFELSHPQNSKIHIINKEVVSSSKEALLSRFRDEEAPKQIQIQFLTPTAFKQRGMYVILPDLRLLYQSLMMRFEASDSKVVMFDEETLEQLVEYSYISFHRLRSVSFPLQGKSIPGFVGQLTIRFKGPETLARYARMLFEFGEYSGVGIKTGMGMGAIKILKENTNGKRTV